MSTYVAKSAEIQRKWFVVDAEGQTLGRLASEVASVLRGKHKPEFTPFLDTGDYVIVINAAKLVLTGNKLDQKIYRYHTLYPGGMKETKARNMMGRAMYRKLKVYAGPEHENAAQKPEALKFSI
jgi:large subunit ribosomal protein L13